MESDKKNQNEKKEVGESCYLNNNCWLVKNLNSAPYNRCQYCEFKFRNCLFLQYQIISLFLILLSFSLFLLIEKRLPLLLIITIFALIIIYGYFFNKSTEKIIKSNFFLKKTKNALKELTVNLEKRVDEQTKNINEKGQHLQELLNIKNDFLKVVNHQLNTPISMVSGAFSMMDEKIWDAKKSLDVIKTGFKKMSQTVQDFWKAYELEGGNIKTMPEKTDINAIIEKLIAEKQVLPLTLQKELIISLNQPNFKIPAVWCDPQQIKYVISTLLDNAIHYTEKGKVTLSYKLINEKYLKINVIDTGVGISKEDKKILFQKFSRGRTASSLFPDGSGLSLYISKRTVEGNGGEISYESKGLNKGSTFSFTVPIYQNQ